MAGARHRVLHVGGRLADAQMIREALAASNDDSLELIWCSTIAEALDGLSSNHISVVLLDLQLPDYSGIDGLKRLRDAAPGMPILVLGDGEHGDIARQAIQAGAHDYLTAARLDGYWLPRVLRQAIQRTPPAEALFAEMERLEIRLNSLGEALISTDPAGLVTDLNRCAEAMTGWPRARAIGQPLGTIVALADGALGTPAGMEPMPSLRPEAAVNGILIGRDGSEYPVEYSTASIRDHNGVLTGAEVVVRHASAVPALTLRLAHLASYDPLTDLPNRLLLRDRLSGAVVLARRHHRQLAVLSLDIDRLAAINASLGYSRGDALLRVVAQQITACLRRSDTVSRHGGDEFVVVLTEIAHAEDAAHCARNILAALSRRQTLDGYPVEITATIGISVFPADGDSAELLLKRAEIALSHAKDRGRAAYRFFEPELHVRATARQAIETDLYDAVDKHEFQLLYQPRMHLRTGTVIGAEALIRWRHPERGLMGRTAFMPIAENCGLAGLIGRWALHEACRQAQEWQDSGFAPIPVAVNLSGAQLRSKHLLADVSDILKTTGLDPACLEIELTESALMADAETTRAVLPALKALGVQVAIDDYGAGWSSLNSMLEFPVDALKLDKSFFHAISAQSQGPPVVGALIGLAKSLNYRVIAQGIDTRQQFDLIREHDCEGQGAYLSRPLIPQQFVRVVHAAGSPS